MARVPSTARLAKHSFRFSPLLGPFKPVRAIAAANTPYLPAPRIHLQLLVVAHRNDGTTGRTALGRRL